MALTHEDWQQVIDQRDAVARRGMRRLLAGNIDGAKDDAAAWDRFDEQAANIAKELMEGE